MKRKSLATCTVSPKNQQVPPMPPGQMNVEWRAWRQVCKQLAALGVDINKQDALASAIRMWGEELVALREENPEHTESALKQRREEYEQHWIEPRDT